MLEEKNESKTESKLPLSEKETPNVDFTSLTKEQNENLRRLDPSNCPSPHERYQ